MDHRSSVCLSEMSESLKRRRTSPDTYVSINSPYRNGHVSTKAPTPKRASYLSPTKASLARSAPQLLESSASAKKNRESEPNRRQSLRDAVLGNRNLLPAEEQQERQDLESAMRKETTPVEASLTNAQESPTSNVTEKENEVPNTPRHRGLVPASRQTRESSTPHRTGRSTRFASPKIVPQLVDSPRRANRRSVSAEMELPPTPVQLGKDKLPDRPRGLSSSSPGGRDKNRATLRGGNVQSSPLKPRDMPPILSEDEDDMADNAEIASGLGEDEQDVTSTTHDDVPAADVSASGSEDQRGITAPDIRSAKDGDYTTKNLDMIAKNQKIKSLQEELQVLQEESRKLKALGSRLSKHLNIDTESLPEDFGLVLQSIDHHDSNSNLPTDQHPSFQKHTSSYLNLFADAAFVMSYETWEKTVAGRQKFVYQTTFRAAQPWPTDTLKINLETVIDWNTDIVEDVVSYNETKQPELTKWFQSRRQNAVLRCDAATLVNGTSKFFEGCIKRARIWKALIEPQADTCENDYHLSAILKDAVTSQNEAFLLLPYLFKTQHGFASPNAAQKQTRRSLGSAKQLIMTYEIGLDWLGRPEVETDILMTGFNQETVDAAKQLYKQVKQVGGIVEALNGVKNILGLSENANGIDKDQASGTMRTKKGKARRMTIFN